MSAALKPRMTADEFLAWTATLEGDVRYELVGGEPSAMAPERVAHAEAKGLIYERLRAQVRAHGLYLGLSCQVFVDGIGVRVRDDTVYIPDVLVRCGGRLDPDQQEINDPLAIVEVLSPSTRDVDLQHKLIGYFGLPSVVHYLIVDTAEAVIVHHRRPPGGVAGAAIETSLVRTGEKLELQPPGLTLDGVFPLGLG